MSAVPTLAAPPDKATGTTATGTFKSDDGFDPKDFLAPDAELQLENTKTDLSAGISITSDISPSLKLILVPSVKLPLTSGASPKRVTINTDLAGWTAGARFFAEWDPSADPMQTQAMFLRFGAKLYGGMSQFKFEPVGEDEVSEWRPSFNGELEGIFYLNTTTFGAFRLRIAPSIALSFERTTKASDEVAIIAGNVAGAQVAKMQVIEPPLVEQIGRIRFFIPFSMPALMGDFAAGFAGIASSTSANENIAPDPFQDLSFKAEFWFFYTPDNMKTTRIGLAPFVVTNVLGDDRGEMVIGASIELRTSVVGYEY